MVLPFCLHRSQLSEKGEPFTLFARVILSAAKRRVGLIGGVLLWLLLFGAVTSFAQSLGEVARQERERRKNQTRRATHVYTDDDLKKPQILNEQDRARALAARKDAPVPAEQATEVPAPASLATMPPPATAANPAAMAARKDAPALAEQASGVTAPASPAAIPAPAPASPVTIPPPATAASPAAMISPVALAAKTPPEDAAHYRLRKQLGEETAISHVQRPTLLPPSASRQESLPSVSERKQDDSRVAVDVRIKRGDSRSKRLGEQTAINRVRRPTLLPPSAKRQESLPSTSERKQGDSPVAVTVRVEPGDSLWKLTKRHLGSGARWRELAALNPRISNPDYIRAGDWIRLPSGDSRIAKQFLVRAGDTLWSVARMEFGNSRAVPCIARANPQLRNADLIYPGQTLVVPLACSVARGENLSTLVSMDRG